MAREWRETDGRSGLPVVDLGHVLRVPRRALEELIGAELTDVDSPTRVEETKRNRTAGRTAETTDERTSRSDTCPAITDDPANSTTPEPHRRISSTSSTPQPRSS